MPRWPALKGKKNTQHIRSEWSLKDEIAAELTWTKKYMMPATICKMLCYFKTKEKINTVLEIENIDVFSL